MNNTLIIRINGLPYILLNEKCICAQRVYFFVHAEFGKNVKTDKCAYGIDG